jgi:hypothetical protein
VNEAIGKLRLLELEPLKLAIMDALQRAWSFMPPLHVQSKEAGAPAPALDHGFEKRVDLKRAIDCLAIDDSGLRQLCDEFYRACEEAGQKWFEARRYAEKQSADASIASIKAVYSHHPFEGEKSVALVRDLYIKLSQTIEKALRG